tara:strand:- start:55 stop:456 length:402 start_codon:yes stop_codon:yes gene_type:complete
MIALPDELLNIIFNNLSIYDKSKMRVTCKELKYFINYMNIRIYKMNEKLNDTFMLFTINENTKKFIPIGLLTEWEAQLCWCRHSNSRRLRRSNNFTRYEIKELIYKYVGQNNNPSIWFYEAITNWVLLEKNKN